MNQPNHITVSPAKLEKTNGHIGTAGSVWELATTGATTLGLAPALFRHVSDFMVHRDGFKHITNVLSGIVVLMVAYLTICNISPMFAARNIPVVIVGMFPILASFGMFLGVLISEPMSLLRVLYLIGMFTTLILGV